MRARERRTRIRRLCAHGELETVFQPMIDLGSDDRIAYEALTRFPGQSRTTRECFADATELGVGAELELAAVRSALGHLPDFPPGTRLSINVSPASSASTTGRATSSGGRSVSWRTFNEPAPNEHGSNRCDRDPVRPPSRSHPRLLPRSATSLRRSRRRGAVDIPLCLRRAPTWS